MTPPVRPDSTTQGMPPRILSPDEFEQARMVPPDQLGAAKFPVLPPPYVPKDAVKTLDPNTPTDKGTQMPGLAGILMRQVVSPIANHPLMAAGVAAAQLTPLAPAVNYYMLGQMGKDVLEYSAQKAAELSLPPDERKQAEADPNRISGEQAGVEAAMMGIAPAVRGVVKAAGGAGKGAAAAEAAAKASQDALKERVTGHMNDVAGAIEHLHDPVAQTETMLRSGAGHMNAANEQAMFKLNDFREATQPLPMKDKLDFYNYAEHGEQQVNPEFQKPADVMRKILDQDRDDVIALGTGKLENYIENYMPHSGIWDDPEQAATAMKGAMARQRPMEGNTSWSKERTFMTVQDGIDAGAKVRDDFNPVDAFRLTHENMQKYIFAHRFMARMKEADIVQYQTGMKPDGHAWIDDKIGTVFGPRSGAVTLPEGAQVAGGETPNIPRPRTTSGRLKNLGSATTEELANEYALAKSGDPRIEPEVGPPKAGGPSQIHEGGSALAPTSNAALTGKLETELTKRGISPRDALTHGQAAVDAQQGAMEGTARPMKPEDVQVQGRRIMGRYSAPEPVANTINNYFAPGLAATLKKSFPGRRGELMAATANAFRTVGNTMNAAQLGLSGAHLMFTSLDAVTSRAALALEYAVHGIREGDPASLVEGVHKAITAGFAPLPAVAQGLVGDPVNFMTKAVDQKLGTNLRTDIAWGMGAKIRQAYLNPEGAAPEMKALADAVATANLGIHMDPYYKGSWPERWAASLHNADALADQGQYGKALLEYGKSKAMSLPAILEMAAKPIMEHIVPLQKLQAFGDLAKFEMDRFPIDATLMEREHRLQLAGNSIENRMGQLKLDNLFWTKTFRDIMQLGIRAVGWNVGTPREIGGGTLDLAKMAQDAVTPGQRAELTHRTAYVIALPLTVALHNAIYQYLRTGKGPEELKDYMFPKTGDMTPDGDPERIQPMSYLKDIYSVTHHPFTTIENKAQPVISMTAQMVNNKDYYGDEIRNPNDPLVKQLMQEAEFVGKTLEPFSLRNMEEQSGRAQTSSGTKIGNWFGYLPAPREVVRTQAENDMTDMLAKRGHSELTPEQADAAQTKQVLIAGLRGNHDVDLQKALNDVMAQGVTEKQLLAIAKKAGMEPAQAKFKALGVDDAMKVYLEAPDWQQKKFRELMADKLDAAAKRNSP